MYNRIKEMLDEKVNEIFLEIQQEEGIKSGDTDIMLEYELRHDMAVLASAIVLNLEWQKEWCK